jgi:transcriptional regulator with XRE-family HTH domain
MIASPLVDEIKRLLSVGELSQREIALRTGVSRGTVGAVARGKRPDYEAARRKRANSFTAPAGPPVRCPGCGGMAQMPCLACHVRGLVNRERTITRRYAALHGNRV